MATSNGENSPIQPGTTHIDRPDWRYSDHFIRFDDLVPATEPKPPRSGWRPGRLRTCLLNAGNALPLVRQALADRRRYHVDIAFCRLICDSERGTGQGTSTMTASN